MCGINGVIAFKEAGRKYVSNIRPSTDTLIKRGPDGNAIFQDEDLALGHCRLSIIDTSAVSNQPMYADGGRYVIIFNGEIL
ncbi:MAG: asparagine synthase (glutamine-hydrolyzing), partial [Flavisolibacter sp.]